MKTATKEQIKTYFVAKLNASGSVCTTGMIADFRAKRIELAGSRLLEEVAREVAQEMGFNSFEYRNFKFQMPGSGARQQAARVARGYVGYV